jgi:hypothetical protein
VTSPSNIDATLITALPEYVFQKLSFLDSLYIRMSPLVISQRLSGLNDNPALASLDPEALNGLIKLTKLFVVWFLSFRSSLFTQLSLQHQHIGTPRISLPPFAVTVASVCLSCPFSCLIDQDLCVAPQ